MRRRRAAAVLAMAALAAFSACARERPAPPPGAGEKLSAAPELPIDTMPKLLESPIAYPEEARARRIQGSVVIRALVAKDGSVREVSADSSQSASPLLVQAAMAAIWQWKFEPARAKGEPVETWTSVPVHYRLQ